VLAYRSLLESKPTVTALITIDAKYNKSNAANGPVID
jgi:hypothetical protein